MAHKAQSNPSAITQEPKILSGIGTGGEKPGSEPAGQVPVSENKDTLAAGEGTGPSLVVITGMAGAGKTQALHTFEDIGYFCIDNLPPSLLLNLVTLSGLPTKTERRLAVVCDLRSQELFSELQAELNHLSELEVSFSVIFLDATDESLLKRYKESRRRHPLCEGAMTLLDGISKEREALASIRETAHYVIDTTNLDTRELRRHIRSLFADSSETDGLRVSVFSFGFKHGFPHDADIVIDVRFLPNPYYEEELRPLTGIDEPVRAFVLESEQTRQFMQSWEHLLETIMPGYVQEGKRYLSLAVGCTGGQHRSVVIADETARFLNNLGYSVSLSHRHLPLAVVQVPDRTVSTHNTL
ncbi:MAG: RNase adapter RapZ [Coriobacteriales bacterium]|nr:RNase adapter RapZ [Coriobacteriales bacterium]